MFQMGDYNGHINQCGCVQCQINNVETWYTCFVGPFIECMKDKGRDSHNYILTIEIIPHVYIYSTVLGYKVRKYSKNYSIQ